ncbi:MAG: hypothetical protein F6J86_31285 [Symploca sp. SIO1B1]|nr:hypothetical protein [Symploca sp. SIO1B1]
MFSKLLRGQIPMKRVIGLVLLLVITTFSFLPTSEALAVDIYRGVDKRPNNKVKLNASQFQFTGQQEPRTLSTFNNLGLATGYKPCGYMFTVQNIEHNGNPLPEGQDPQAGDNGQVHIQITQDKEALYTATFDNAPPGHWGITHPDNVTDGEAKQAVSKHAKANPGNVRGDNCIAPDPVPLPLPNN